MQTGKAISVPAILKVGNGTLNQLGSYLKGEGLKQVVIFLGNGLIDMFGETVRESLKKKKLQYWSIANWIPLILMIL